MPISKKEISSEKQEGLTLIEVLIAMAFISLLYAFVIQVFFHGFKNITSGDIQDEGVRLAKNEMIRLSSIENPLYIGLKTKENGDDLINKLKTKEKTPYDYVDEGIIKLKVKEEVRKETASTSEDVKRSSNDRADYERITEWQVEDVEPVLVHLWVTVKWTDPKGEFKSDQYVLETLLTP